MLCRTLNPAPGLSAAVLWPLVVLLSKALQTPGLSLSTPRTLILHAPNPTYPRVSAQMLHPIRMPPLGAPGLGLPPAFKRYVAGLESILS